MGNIKLSLLIIASALFTGCATQAGPVDGLETGSLDAVAAGPDEPGAYQEEDDDALEIEVLGEQWLRFESLATRQPLGGLELCDQRDSNLCADTDRGGELITHWTLFGQGFRMLGWNGDDVKFVLLDQALETDINRLFRPILVLTEAQLDRYYGQTLTTRDPAHHTAIAHAKLVADSGLSASADQVRFELRPLGFDEKGVLAPSYPDRDGSPNGSLQASVGQGYAVFLDVTPGRYELTGERNGLPCTSAEVWLDGITSQVVLPELHCE